MSRKPLTIQEALGGTRVYAGGWYGETLRAKTENRLLALAKRRHAITIEAKVVTQEVPPRLMEDIDVETERARRGE